MKGRGSIKKLTKELSSPASGSATFIDETLVARHYRDSKILEIGEGTSEVQRIIIARQLVERNPV